MTTREYHHTDIDKSEWGEGPWVDEPDKITWTDPDTGLPCMIHRNHVGALCGYVGVTEEHPYFGKEYDDVPVEVHGGLTYSNLCQPLATEEDGICHIPEPGASDHVWWFGFDCAHSGDICPSYEKMVTDGTLSSNPLGYGSYKTREYVEAEVGQLAGQLYLLT